jgi:hypothetical protein
MTSRLNEVQTRMNTVINHLHPVDPVLLLQVRVESRLDVVEDRLPALLVVDKVSVSRRVYDRQTQADSILLDVCRRMHWSARGRERGRRGTDQQ